MHRVDCLGRKKVYLPEYFDLAVRLLIIFHWKSADVYVCVVLYMDIFCSMLENLIYYIYFGSRIYFVQVTMIAPSRHTHVQLDSTYEV